MPDPPSMIGLNWDDLYDPCGYTNPIFATDGTDSYLAMYPPEMDANNYGGFYVRPNFRLDAYMAPSLNDFTPRNDVLGLSSLAGDIVTPTMYI